MSCRKYGGWLINVQVSVQCKLLQLNRSVNRVCVCRALVKIVYCIYMYLQCTCTPVSVLSKYPVPVLSRYPV